MLNAYHNLIDPLNERVDKLEKDRAECEVMIEAQRKRLKCVEFKLEESQKENARLTAGITILVNHMIAHSIEPPWKP